MNFEKFKATVQPELEQDLDTVYEEFVEDSGSDNLVQFLDHLLENSLIDQAIRDRVLAEIDGTLAQANPAAQAPADAEESAAAEPADPAEPAEKAAPAEGGEFVKLPEGVGGDSSTFNTELLDDSTQQRIRRRSDAGSTGTRKRQTGTRTGARTGARTGGRGRKRATAAAPQEMIKMKPPEERYEFIGTVGEGAMGKVHLALDTSLNRKVAFKQITAEIAAEPTMASKFASEAQITAQLDHPNIVPVYALEQAPDGMPAYTMKLIKGETVENLIERAKNAYEQKGSLGQDLELNALLEHFLKCCDALAYAHSRGCIHRDLKPENIMVGAFNEIYIMDWGISMVFSTDVDDPVTVGAAMDEGELIIGTPQYMSPEQANGENNDLDDKSDQYAMGLILYELVGLQPAVTGKTAIKIVMRQQDAEKNPLTHISPKVMIAPELRAIIAKATHKDKQHRYPSVAELAEDIRRFRRGEAVIAKKDTLWQALLRWVSNHRELTLMAVVSTFFVSGLLIVFLVVGYQLRLQAQQVREGQVSNLLTTVGRQASLIDGQFLKYEGLLSVIAATATEMLERAPIDYSTPVYNNEGFADPKNHPKDLEASARYNMPISLASPVFLKPPKPGAGINTSIRKLLPLQRQYYQVLLRSLKEDAASYTPKRARRAIEKAALSWIYVGLEDGLQSSFPGHGGFPQNFDPRERPWYTLAKGTRGPMWGAPHADIGGMGLTLSCATSLYDSKNRFLGVAGIDVTFDYIIEELLEIEKLAAVPGIESFLLDKEAHIVVRSSKKGKKVSGSSGRELRMPKFMLPEVVEAVDALESSYVEVERDGKTQMAVYSRMHSLGWYYVVLGEADDLLSQFQ
jgi:serine/threonine-protein kinase